MSAEQISWKGKEKCIWVYDGDNDTRSFKWQVWISFKASALIHSVINPNAPFLPFKGVFYQFVFFRSNLILWIVMGCGIADFSRSTWSFDSQQLINSILTPCFCESSPHVMQPKSANRGPKISGRGLPPGSANARK